ncbi:MAG: molybdate ABC transporter substrate-binding protein [Caldilineaceae bacterium]|nr:molybdate ABC transporter substrate-binding protein [Caldilineaceae bacterium]
MRSQLWRVWRSLALVMAVSAMVACSPIAPAAQEAAPDNPVQPELVVFAAASLTDAFQAIGETFAAEHDAVVTFNFAGSQQLAQQLSGGAPADVFASANARQMEAAVGTGRIDAGTIQTFAHNRLVVVTPADNPGEIATLADLARPGIKLVLADSAVPVGQYSLDFLAKAIAQGEMEEGYDEAVLANIVSYENNVRTVLAKVVLGEADAGIVYSSDVTGEERNRVQIIDIPDALNVVASYPVAPLQDSAHPELAAAFVDYLRSARGQATLAEYGFIPITTE